MTWVNNSEKLLLELNENKLNDLIPLFVILGLLLLIGLLGNAFLISYVWSEAKRNVGTFFLLILAGVDMLISLTVILVLYEYSKIYIFRSEAVCKISAFLRFAASLFSAFVLVTIAIHRYQMICRPLKNILLDVSVVKTVTIIATIGTIILSVPQVLLVETRDIEVSHQGNLTLMGSDCVVRVLSNTNLKGFHTFIEATYATLFIGSFVALFVLYVLLGKAILEANRNHDRLTQTTYFASISRRKGDGKENEPTEDNIKHDTAEPNNDTGKTILIDNSAGRATKTPHRKPGARKTSSTPSNNSSKVGRQRNVDYISSTKLTVMFFIITLGFILSFLPYIIYSTWRNFSAERTDVAFTVSPLNLFCLNSYLINSVINFVVYGFFNKRFRLYLKNCLRCRRGS